MKDYRIRKETTMGGEVRYMIERYEHDSLCQDKRWVHYFPQYSYAKHQYNDIEEAKRAIDKERASDERIRLNKTSTTEIIEY